MRSLIIALSLGFPTICLGELEFEQKAIDIAAKPADENLPVVFAFKNAGEKPVTIDDISYACSCLSAETDKEVYAPGEGGELTALFKLGSFTGYQRKAMTVISKEEGGAEAQRTQLMVGVKIPDVIKIEPELLSWTVKDEPVAKKFTVKIPHTDPIKIKQISCSRTGWDFELKVVEEGRHYEIELLPESTGSPMLGVLKIETDCAIVKHQRKLAFFSIARKRRS